MLHRACTEYCNMVHEASKRYEWAPPMIECSLGKIWKTHSPRYPKNIFPEVACIRLSFLHLISNGLNEVIK